MDLFHRNDLRALLDAECAPCVSLYMPTDRAAPASHGNPIRFKNLLKAAFDRLTAEDRRRPDVERLLAPGAELLDDSWFWTHQSDGLALFLGQEFTRQYRLPKRFLEHVYVGSSFDVAPLLSLLHATNRFYVLAVSPKSCRLLQGTRFEIAELDVNGLPEDLQSALNWWNERELHLHSMQPSPQSRAGGATAVYHGHEDDVREIDLAAYFRRVDQALHPVLRMEEAPLVFAGAKESFPIFCEVSEYPHLVDEPLAGNSDHLSARELHAAAWPLVEPLFRQQELRALDAFGAQQSAQRASDEAPRIRTAASLGLVDALIVDRKSIESAEPDLAADPSGGSLLHEVVRDTLRHGGQALVVDRDQMPSQQPMAALLRAPLHAIPAAL